MNLKARLLSEADAWVARTGLSHARLASIVINDGKFFERVRKGGEFKVSTYERFMKYFAGTGRFVPRISPNDRRTRARRQAQGRDAAV